MIIFALRYEDEINKRTECENDFVLIKKVSIEIQCLRLKIYYVLCSIVSDGLLLYVSGRR